MKFIVLSMVMHRNIMPQILWETKIEIRKWSHSVMSDYLWLRGLLPTRIPCPWDFPGKSTRVACHFLLQGILPTQGLNQGLPHCRQTLYRLSHQGNQNGKNWHRICVYLLILSSYPMMKTKSFWLGEPSSIVSGYFHRNTRKTR